MSQLETNIGGKRIETSIMFQKIYSEHAFNIDLIL